MQNGRRIFIGLIICDFQRIVRQLHIHCSDGLNIIIVISACTFYFV
jgi:hypothetical protein